MSGSLRANVGKKDANALRRDGKVPCVLYGGPEQVRFAVDERQFKHLVFTPEAHSVEIDLNGKKHNAILKELQQHPVTDRILHADFIEVLPGKPVTVALPVKTTGGIPAGVKAGGNLQRKLRKMNVRGPIEKMPAAIELNVEKLELGQSIRVSDIKIDGLTFLDKPNMTVVSVKFTRHVEEEVKTAAATTAAPAAGTTAATATPAAAAPAADAKKPAADDKKKK